MLFLLSVVTAMVVSYHYYHTRPDFSRLRTLLHPIVLTVTTCEYVAMYLNMNSNDFWMGFSFSILPYVISNYFYLFLILLFCDFVERKRGRTTQ